MKRSISALLGTIAERLESIRKVLDNLVSTIDAAQHRETEAGQRDNIAIAEQTRLANTTERKRSAEQKKNLCVQWVIGSGTWAAVIAACIYAGIAANQLTVMQNSADAARRQLEITDRAWVKVEVAPNFDIPKNSFIGQSLTFDANDVGHLSRKIILHNIGHSVANDVMIRDSTVAMSIWNHDFWFPIKVRDELCKSEISETDAQGNKRPSFIIFPQDSTKTYEISTFETKNLPDSPQDATLQRGKPIALYLVGCVDYRYGQSSVYHRTGFIFQVYGGPNHDGIQIKMPTPVKELTLDSFYLGGDYAY